MLRRALFVLPLVHLALTNEWQQQIAWHPVLPASEVPGRYNPQGRMWASGAEVLAHASLEEIGKEVRAQIRKAEAAGLQITHLDSHMHWPLWNDALFQIHADLPRQTSYVVVPQLHRIPYARQRLFTGQAREQEGVLVTDTYTMLYNPAIRQIGQAHAGYAQALAQMPAGVNHAAIHPAHHTATLEKRINDMALRHSDYLSWADPTMADTLKALGIGLIGYAPIAELQRQRGGRACTILQRQASPLPESD